ncbi:spondin domain-containing protein [Photobacterium sp. DNB23_23_1]|uniref:Spondin domain-containing protein n=1 Tax=Photobacterium pectinilyticum TaxID=2906793 RepID=A0ABT1N1K9_9GAMM|nr:spondin domain-containing protein [Photobacterium sp. ZSDE20]MCQ1058625.1 spondin domain-containing protein [Photobacterium sp. ZSDE20]MDD1824055.1 spondin domain-containing protein [Photobacterium sp. ZSDE20]
MNKTLTALSLAAAFISTGQTQAAEIDVTITNATKNIYFTPLLVAAHSSDIFLFRSGEAAGSEVEQMAEGGDIGPLSSLASNAGAVVVSNPASGPLNPGDSTTASMDTGDADSLSITAMLLPTNDGFVGLDSWPIPTTPGTYTVRLNGYDAGTEANDELATSMPNPPFVNLGTGGSGAETTVTNTSVHIHPGNLGDTDPTGGISDISSTAYRWLNPVAVVTVTVK